MRVNLYAEELTHDVEVFSKTSETGREFFAVRFYFHSSPRLHFRLPGRRRSDMIRKRALHNRDPKLRELPQGEFPNTAAAVAAAPGFGGTVHTPQEARALDFLKKLEGCFNCAESIGEARGMVLRHVREFLGLSVPPKMPEVVEAKSIAPGVDGKGCVREIPSHPLPGFPGSAPEVFIDRYREAWQHAGCLTIAEGGPDWEKPTADDSAAMISVRKLRTDLESLSAEHDQLRKKYDQQRRQLFLLQDVVGSITTTMNRLKS